MALLAEHVFGAAGSGKNLVNHPLCSAWNKITRLMFHERVTVKRREYSFLPILHAIQVKVNAKRFVIVVESTPMSFLNDALCLLNKKVILFLGCLFAAFRNFFSALSGGFLFLFVYNGVRCSLLRVCIENPFSSQQYFIRENKVGDTRENWAPYLSAAECSRARSYVEIRFWTALHDCAGALVHFM